MKPCIIFFGTPEFAVLALEALVRAGYEVVAVVTQLDKPVGRGLKTEAPPVKVKAQELGLTVFQPATLKNTGAELSVIRKLGSLNCDLGIAVAYGKIIPKSVLDLFPRGILSIHPSLLPKYRGPSPIQAAILNGDAETGVSIMLLDEEMDHGAILAHAKIAITRTDTDESLSKTLSKHGARLLIETLPKYLASEIAPQPQDHSKATYTKILTREDGHIDWKKPAEHIERLVRAYDLWPGTWTTWMDKRLKVLSVSILHPFIGCASNSTPGYVWQTETGQLTVNCNPGSLLLEQLQLEGAKALSVAEFLRGHTQFIGSIL